ncbi:MAG: type 2 isopentenyl-diphosphate Delta-isomerase [Thermoplasmata archaeon]|nr:type 2 isopentenyl-diphosphate Delta-isomerase [Thermoplasmata archaeon]
MIVNRKEEHLRICLERDVTGRYNYWDDLRFIHQSVPGFDMEDIDIAIDVFGKRLKAPFIISGMTGGCESGKAVNENLAVAAEELGIGMGVGSQRAALEKPELVDSYSVILDYEIPLVYANIGAPQLIPQGGGHKPIDIEAGKQAMEMVGADLLAIHLNYLQEIAQPEGDLKARGVIEAITELSSELPILAKETGAGMSRKTAIRLKDAGVRGIDVGGAGGTSFSAVEVYRAMEAGDVLRERLGRTFWNWGIPTPVSVRLARVGLQIIATGGLRNGLDLARAIAVGADAGGFACQLLSPAMESPEAVVKEIELILEELKVVMFLTGARNINELRNMRLIEAGRIKDWGIRK